MMNFASKLLMEQKHLLSSNEKEEFDQLCNEYNSYINSVTKFRETSQSISKTPKMTGIKRWGNNCWAICLFQCFMNIPSLRVTFESYIKSFQVSHPTQAENLNSIIAYYDNARLIGKPLPMEISYDLRQIFSKLYPAIPSDDWTEEDPLLFLRHMLDQVKENPYQMQVNISRQYELIGEMTPIQEKDKEQYSKAPPLDQELQFVETSNEIFIPLQDTKGGALEELFKSWAFVEEGKTMASYLTQSEDHIQPYCLKNETKKIEKAPKSLLVNLGRFGFSQENKQAYKIFDNIYTPFSLTLPSNILMKDVRADYELKAVISHAGESINSGHYIVYLKRYETTWIICNDDWLTEITSAQMKAILDGTAQNEKFISYSLIYEKADDQKQEMLDRPPE